MIKIRTAQLAAVPSHIRKNLKQIEKEAALARAEGAHILVLPEMCLTGYLIGDIWDQNAFLKECERANEKVAALSKGLTIVWGSLAVDWDLINDDGRPRKYNAAFAASNGHFIYPEGSPLPFTVKTLLPDYRCFDDRRYFTSLESLALEEGKRPEDILAPFVLPAGKEELRCGIVLCEDSWDENYRISPMSILAEKGISLFLNLSASPFTMGKDGKRNRMFSESLSRLSIPMLYVNRRGLENNGKDCYTYDGMTAAYDKDGQLIAEANPFTDERSTFYFNQENLTLAPETEMEPTDENLLLPAFRYGTSEFLKAIGASKVVIGVSGGIDSAVNAALYRSILPAENILLVNTPTRYNSELTKGLAAELAKNLGCQLLTVPIGDFIDETADALEGLPLPDDTVHLTGFMKENMQARDRSSRILAALSAAFGGIFTCNANKTETTVGYGTLYGDLAGAFAATADLWKYQIYDLGRKLNAWYGRAVIPEGIFTVMPSAELSENQDVTQGKGDPLIYEYHDYLFRSFIEPWQRQTPEDILKAYAKGNLEDLIGCSIIVSNIFPTAKDFIEDLEKWWNLFSGFAVAKRIQTPPLLAVSRRPYGYDLRESQLRPYYTDAYLSLKEKLLAD